MSFQCTMRFCVIAVLVTGNLCWASDMPTPGYEPLPTRKSEAKAHLVGSDCAETLAQVRELAKVSPAEAILPPLQAIIMPSPDNSEGMTCVISFLNSRTGYTAGLSNADMQVMLAAANLMVAYEKNNSGNGLTAQIRGFFSVLYRDGCETNDITVLEQREKLCEVVHAVLRNEDNEDFTNSRKAKQFLRKKLHLLEQNAPRIPIPQPPPRPSSENGF